jgi:hypothetical protein
MESFNGILVLFSFFILLLSGSWVKGRLSNKEKLPNKLPVDKITLERITHSSGTF